jgi:hypothetical protein
MPSTAPAPSSPSAAPPPAASAAVAVQRLSVGRVVGRTFSVWFGNFVPFAAVSLVFYLPVLILAALVPEESGPGFRILDQLLSVAAQLLVSGALTSGVLVSLGGGRSSARALLGAGVQNFGTVFATSFRVGLWLLLGTVLLVVPGMVWYCALFVAVPAAVVEKDLASSADALRRSRELTAGSRWPILAVSLVVLAATFAAVAAASALGALPLPAAVPVVFTTAVIALTTGLSACAAAVAYHDLRAAREGVPAADLAKVFE